MIRIVDPIETTRRCVLPQRQTVVIDDALASEASEVRIEVELLCGCDCKNVESSRCEHGIDECGICKCDFGWSGKRNAVFPRVSPPQLRLDFSL